MKREIIVLISIAILILFNTKVTFAQYHDYLAFDRFVADPLYSDFISRLDFHAGIHSGSWTIRREQILDKENKDKYRSCSDPYCNRCSKHLADYGHEYQYISGTNQRQLWYRGTAGSIAPVRQFGYDEHGRPYAHRGQPGAVMAWEYVQVLNHAIWEQVQARNAVADEEAAEDRVGLLSELRDAACNQLQQSRDTWELVKHSGHCLAFGMPCSPCTQVFEQMPIFPLEPSETLVFTPQSVPVTRLPVIPTIAYGKHRGVSYNPHYFGLCEYCAAKAQYCFDMAYVAEVNAELSRAIHESELRKMIADEAVRIALLSKPDADRATRFKRIQMKPPRYQEVLAAKEAAEQKDKDVKK